MSIQCCTYSFLPLAICFGSDMLKHSCGIWARYLGLQDWISPAQEDAKFRFVRTPWHIQCYSRSNGHHVWPSAGGANRERLWRYTKIRENNLPSWCKFSHCAFSSLVNFADIFILSSDPADANPGMIRVLCYLSLYERCQCHFSSVRCAYKHK